jgi:ParB family chromosome partitioning protein
MATIRDKLAAKKSKLAAPQAKLKDHPANLNDYQDGSFYNVDIDLITADPDQPRKYFDQPALSELSQSIKQKGVLQPVIIRKDQAGKIVLVAGERRFRAAKMAGLEKIPAVMTKGNPLEISIIENLQRENLTPIEEAEALSRMIEEHSYTQDKLAFVIGKAKSTISETISLNRLPDEIKNEVRRAEQYPRRLLVEIAKQDTKKAMIDLFKRVKDGNLKSEDVRDIARKRPERTQRTPAAVAADKVLALTNHLSKLNFETIEQSEKSRLIMDLHNLKKAIEKIIS